ncbi:MAG: hypothetical protein V1709_05815 [Planctomycetota bacterium]
MKPTSLLVPEIEIDDRDPMDRVADELAKFTEAIKTMSQEQAEALLKALQLLVLATDRPKEWSIEVAKRDRNGMIESVRLIADDRVVQ